MRGKSYLVETYTPSYRSLTCHSPGRFFAANELKCLLAHIVLDYDVAFEEGADYPPSKCVMGNFVPADVELRFRKRQS